MRTFRYNCYILLKWTAKARRRKSCSWNRRQRHGRLICCMHYHEVQELLDKVRTRCRSWGRESRIRGVTFEWRLCRQLQLKNLLTERAWTWWNERMVEIDCIFGARAVDRFMNGGEGECNARMAMMEKKTWKTGIHFCIATFFCIYWCIHM